MARRARTDTQTSLRLPQELYDQLAQAASEKGRSVGEEMRQRLAASFLTPKVPDIRSRDLLVAVARAAAFLYVWFGHWAEDVAVCGVLAQTFGKILAMRGPKVIDPIPPLHPKLGSPAVRFFGDNPNKD